MRQTIRGACKAAFQASWGGGKVSRLAPPPAQMGSGAVREISEPRWAVFSSLNIGITERQSIVPRHGTPKRKMQACSRCTATVCTFEIFWLCFSQHAKR